MCDITIFIAIRYRYDSYDYMPMRYDIDNFLKQIAIFIANNYYSWLYTYLAIAVNIAYTI